MKIIRQQEGNVLIEVAVFLPILITLLLGVLDCGFLLQEYMTMVDSVRAGAEVAMIRNYAVINGTNTTYVAQVATNSSLNIPNYSVTVSNYCTCGPNSSPGTTVSCGSYAGCPGYGIPAQYVKLVATASLPVLFSFKRSSRYLQCPIDQHCPHRLDGHPMMERRPFQRVRAAMKRLGLEQDGSILIELGVCLPVAMTMTFGFIYFALLVFGMCSNAFCQRAALRYACLHSSTSTNPTTQAALDAIVARYTIPYPTNTTTISCSYGGLGNTVGQPINVIVIATYSMAIFGTTYNSPQLSWGSVGVVIN